MRYENSAGALPTSVAEQNLRCCMRTKVNKVDNYPLANLNYETYGWPKVIYQWSNQCNMDYPAYFGGGFKSLPNYSVGTAVNGALTVTFENADSNVTGTPVKTVEYYQYCDGAM